MTVPHRFPPSWNLEEDKRDEAGAATPGLLRLTMDGYLTAHCSAPLELDSFMRRF